MITSTPCLSERGGLVKNIIKLMQIIGVAPPIVDLSYEQIENYIQTNGFEIKENEILDIESNTKWIVAKKL